MNAVGLDGRPVNVPDEPAPTPPPRLPNFTIADVRAAREELARRHLGKAIPALADLRLPRRYKGGWGGRGSGKSHTFAELVVLVMLEDPDASVVCIREIQKSLKLSARKLIVSKIKTWQLDHLFDIQETQIKRRGGEGICIFQGMQDHTADSIKSLEGFKIAWVEEAQSLSANSLELLRPTIRAEGSEIWFSWNPRRRSDPVEKLLRARDGERENAIVRRANYTDNPHLPEELRLEAEDSKANEDADTYAHVWLGAYQGLGSKVVIPPAWVEAAIGLVEDMGLAVTGKKYSALDVAGAEDGGDENGWAGRHGIELQRLEVWNGMDTGLTTNKAVGLAVEYGSNDNFYDSVSVGEGVTGEWGGMGRRGERPNGMKLLPWNAGSSVLDPDEHTDPRNPTSPLNKDQYLNLKAQGWFALRKRFENAYKCRMKRPYDAENLISIRKDLPGLDQLQDELSQPQQKPSQTGKTMVDKQPDNTPSPNRADPVMMAFFPLPPDGYDIGAAL